MSRVGTRRRARLAGGILVAIAVPLFAGCQPASRPAPATHRVTIRAMRFEPAALTVAAGDTVRWTNLDLVPHTVSSSAGAFESGDLSPDASWSMVPRDPDTLDYICRYHPTMKGSIAVGTP